MFSPVKQATTGTNLAAFTGGVNASAPLYGMQPNECVYSYNMLANEYGMRVRSGTKEWANGVTGTGVRTVLPYIDTNEELFVATSTGIWDVTTEGDTSPVQVVTWPLPGDPAGECIFLNFSNSAGNFLLVCDALNGYYVYDGTSWTTPALTDGGPNIRGDAAFVTMFKERLWFLFRNSPDAFYLDAQAITGALTRFTLGDKFEYGGDPVGLWDWTLDGGTGPDNYLVAIGSQGDCLVYSGLDPDTPPGLNLVGKFYVGELPEGRRVAIPFGGDLVVLSTNGVLSLGALLRGNVLDTATNYLTQSIEPLIRALMTSRRSLFGWSLHVYQRESFLMITVPAAGQRPLQFTMDTSTKRWSIWRDMPCYCAGVWDDRYYIGTDENRLYELTGNTDQVNIDASGNLDIEFSLLSSFLDFGSPATNKQVQYLKPTFRSSAPPSYAIKAAYDYDFVEELFSGSALTSGTALWDVALWDEAVWGGGVTPNAGIRGGFGLGRMVAVAMKGVSRSPTELVDINVLWRTGGLM